MNNDVYFVYGFGEFWSKELCSGIRAAKKIVYKTSSPSSHPSEKRPNLNAQDAVLILKHASLTAQNLPNPTPKTQHLNQSSSYQGQNHMPFVTVVKFTQLGAK